MKTDKLRPWQTLSRQTLLHHSKYLTVESHSIRLPDGRILSDWAWLIVPDAAIVLARTEGGEFLCFRQTKYAVEGATLAPVGGMLEPGEAPLDGAKRELLEEMGYQAAQWVHLGSQVVDPNRGAAVMHMFLALDAKKVAEPDSDDLEDQVQLFLSQEELERSLMTGEFKVVAWSAAVSLSLIYLSGLRKSA